MRAGHRRGGGFGACSSGIVWGKQSQVRELLRASGHTHVSNIHWGSL